MSDKLLSTRHVRFVRAFLKDGNATKAYIRAGYSRRSAQCCASRLLAQPHIAAAITAGRRRLAQTLEVAVEGLKRIDPEVASQARRAGIIVLKARNDSKQEQKVTLTLQVPEPALPARDRERYEARCPACDYALNHSKEEQSRLERELDEARAALAEARGNIDDAAEALQPMIDHSNRRWRRDVKPRRS
jgi:phage terminase small subunit